MKKNLPFCLLLSVFPLLAHAQNLNVTLSDSLQYPAQDLSNLCSWTDPQDNKEYALVGASDGMSIVDVTNPSNIFEVTQIPN